jgi:hypothetical protein
MFSARIGGEEDNFRVCMYYMQLPENENKLPRTNNITEL